MSQVLGYVGTIFEKGLGETLEITTLAWAFAIVCGVLLAPAGESHLRLVRGVHGILTTALRGMPEIVVIYLLVYGLSSKGIKISPLASVVFALGISQTGFVSEAAVGCMALVGLGQRRAAVSLGLGTVQAYRHVILPQAAAAFAPVALNAYVSTLKLSTIASTVALSEMLYVGQSEIQRSQAVIAPAVAMAIAYLVLTIPLSRLAMLRPRQMLRRTAPAAEPLLKLRFA